MNLDQLELELRKLQGVRWTGFDSASDLLVVQLHVVGGTQPGLVNKATRVASRHSDRPVAVEVVRWPAGTGARESAPSCPEAHGNGSAPGPADAPTPDHDTKEPRLELLSVRTCPEADEVEVHLGNGRSRTVGRAALGRGLLGAAEATVEAIRRFTDTLPFEAGWVRTIETTADRRFLVTVALVGNDRDARYGVAAAERPVDAAARATLHALNRNLALVLADRQPSPAR